MLAAYCASCAVALKYSIDARMLRKLPLDSAIIGSVTLVLPDLGSQLPTPIFGIVPIAPNLLTFSVVATKTPGFQCRTFVARPNVLSHNAPVGCPLIDADVSLANTLSGKTDNSIVKVKSKAIFLFILAYPAGSTVKKLTN